MSIKLQWVVAHEPYYLFENAVKHFSTEVFEKTNGAYEVEIIGISEWSAANNSNLSPKFVDRQEVIDRCRSGEIKLLTTYVESFVYPNSNDLRVLGMPYLFTDHDHATRVLDGDIGKSLLHKVGDDLVGMAFTYSGGYRMLTGSKSLRTLEDFSGVLYACSESIVQIGTAKLLGANSNPMGVDDVKDAIESNRVDVGSSTYARFFSQGYQNISKYINETNHSMFLTCFIMNNEFFKTLSTEHQIIFREAAINAAKVERSESVADISNVKTKAIAAGIEIVTINEKELDRMRLATLPLYDKFGSMFSAGLVESIRNA